MVALIELDRDGPLMLMVHRSIMGQRRFRAAALDQRDRRIFLEFGPWMRLDGKSMRIGKKITDGECTPS